MTSDWAPVVAVLGLAAGFAWIAARISENWMRKKAVESGASAELVESLFRSDPAPSGLRALKWGMVAVALGLGLSVEAVLPYDFEDPIAYGVLLVFGGGALILFYAYVRSSERAESHGTGGRGQSER